MSAPNPFLRPSPGYPNTQLMAGEDRIAAVREFDRDQCRAALEVPGLQKTVEKAIHARLRKLEKQS